MDAHCLGKRLVSPLTDGEIGRIISLKAVGSSTMEVSCMLSRNESTIRSFLKKWTAKAFSVAKSGAPKKMTERTK
jgi:transposase